MKKATKQAQEELKDLALEVRRGKVSLQEAKERLYQFQVSKLDPLAGQVAEKKQIDEKAQKEEHKRPQLGDHVMLMKLGGQTAKVRQSTSLIVTQLCCWQALRLLPEGHI